MQTDIAEQYDRLYRYCFFRLKHAQTAEDITQETFLRFFESRTYRDRGQSLAYLYTIARNLITDEFRRKKHLADESEIQISGGEFETESTDRIALYSAMEALSREDQELLLLRYVNEVPMHTLEQFYGISRFALRRRLKKLTAQLERRLYDGQET